VNLQFNGVIPLAATTTASEGSYSVYASGNTVEAKSTAVNIASTISPCRAPRQSGYTTGVKRRSQ